MGLLDILNQYTSQPAQPGGQVLDHFDEVAAQAPPHELGNGLAAAFRSDATPPFGQSVGNLFGRSDPQAQAGLLNQLVQALGPAALSGVAGSVLGRIFGAGGAMAQPPQITPAQASQVSPADVDAIATHAEQHNGSVVDRIAGFYAQHPQIVKSMGAAALAIALGHMRSQR